VPLWRRWCIRRHRHDRPRSNAPALVLLSYRLSRQRLKHPHVHHHPSTCLPVVARPRSARAPPGTPRDSPRHRRGRPWQSPPTCPYRGSPGTIRRGGRYVSDSARCTRARSPHRRVASVRAARASAPAPLRLRARSPPAPSRGLAWIAGAAASLSFDVLAQLARMVSDTAPNFDEGWTVTAPSPASKCWDRDVQSCGGFVLVQ